MVLGAPPEFKTRTDGIAGLKATYGLTFKHFDPLDESGPITIAALTSGKVQAADVFTTTPAIVSDKLVSLADPKSNFAAQNVIPLVYKPAVTPTITDTLNAVDAQLTTAALLQLDIAVITDKQNYTTAAQAVAAVRRHELRHCRPPPPDVRRRERVTSGGVRITDITVVLHQRQATASASFGPARPVPARGAADRDRRGHRGQRLPVQPRPGPGGDRRPDRHHRQAVAARRGPARHRQALAPHGRPRPLPVAAHRRHGRHRAVGHRGQGRGPAGAPAARHLPRPDTRLLLLRPPRDPGAVRGGGRLLAAAGLAGLQDPPAAQPLAPAPRRAPGRPRHRDLRGRPRTRSATT